MRLITKENYDKLNSAYELIMSIYYAACAADGDEEAWGSACDIIFGAGYCRMVKECIPNFDWYDPDASYQEDVSAFVWALEELMKDIKVI